MVGFLGGGATFRGLGHWECAIQRDHGTPVSSSPSFLLPGPDMNSFATPCTFTTGLKQGCDGTGIFKKVNLFSLQGYDLRYFVKVIEKWWTQLVRPAADFRHALSVRQTYVIVYDPHFIDLHTEAEVREPGSRARQLPGEPRLLLTALIAHWTVSTEMRLGAAGLWGSPEERVRSLQEDVCRAWWEPRWISYGRSGRGCQEADKEEDTQETAW